MTKGYRFYLTLLAIVLTTTAAMAALKVWTGHETLKYDDLNSNFSQVNNSATALITDSKVSTSAAIAHSKLATPALVPKAWGVLALCTSGTCTLGDSSRITSVVHNSTGYYTITLAYTAANTAYAVIVTTEAVPGACYLYTRTTTTIDVKCTDLATPTLEDVGMDFIVMDS